MKMFFRKLRVKLFNPSEVTANIEGYKMRLNLDDGGISRCLYSQGAREMAFMGILKEIVKPGMTCLDLGANLGYATMYMAEGVGASGYVHAIEPDPRNLKLLKKNVALNKYGERCTVMHAAVSDVDKTIELWLSAHPNLNSVKEAEHSLEKIEVPAISLATFFKDIAKPNVIKMDIEGHEVKVFEGGYEFFKEQSWPCALLVEVHPGFYDSENDFRAILEKYLSIGFRPEYVVATPVPDPPFFKERGYVPERIVPTDNVVRGVYRNISNEDFLDVAVKDREDGGGIRSFLLMRD